MNYKLTFMKRILNFALLIVLIISFNSCSRKVGDWDDNIKLSTRTVEFNALGDSVVVKTGGSWWWINSISVNGTYFQGSDDSNYDLYNYTIKHDCFIVERRDKNTLFVKVNENPLNDKRVIKIELEAGDYFDSVTITQKAK